MKLKLIRDEDNGISTIGRLYAEGEFLCYTLENPFVDNARAVSCVPTGCYGMETKRYGRFWDRWRVPIPILTGTEPRKEILIHIGNYSKDTEGCILVGDSKGINAVWNSKKTWFKHLSLLQTATEIVIENKL